MVVYSIEWHDHIFELYTRDCLWFFCAKVAGYVFMRSSPVYSFWFWFWARCRGGRRICLRGLKLDLRFDHGELRRALHCFCLGVGHDANAVRFGLGQHVGAFGIPSCFFSARPISLSVRLSQSILELFWTITIVIVQNNSKMDCDTDT